MTKVKICGLKAPQALEAAIYGGVDFVGLVFHPPSPRHVDIEVASYLSKYVPDSVSIVGLFVNADDFQMSEVLENVRIDILQLAGQESLARTQAIAQRFQKPIIKTFPVQTLDDLSRITAFEPYIDWILLDSSEGGSGKVFDWGMLENLRFSKPWMLAGGLNVQNVREAISMLSPDCVDVSSGVESARGVKDPKAITSFLNAVKNT